MEVKEPKEEKTYYYPTELRTELPVNFFLSKIIAQNASAKIPYLKEKVYCKVHNTKCYPVGTFQKPISNIL